MKTANIDISDSELADYRNYIAISLLYTPLRYTEILTSSLSEVELKLGNGKEVYGWRYIISKGLQAEMQHSNVFYFPDKITPIAKNAMKGLKLLKERNLKYSRKDLSIFRNSVKITANQIRQAAADEYYRSFMN